MNKRFTSFPKPEEKILHLILTIYELISNIRIAHCVFLVEKEVKILLIFYMGDFITRAVSGYNEVYPRRDLILA